MSSSGGYWLYCEHSPSSINHSQDAQTRSMPSELALASCIASLYSASVMHNLRCPMSANYLLKPALYLVPYLYGRAGVLVHIFCYILKAWHRLDRKSTRLNSSHVT